MMKIWAVPWPFQHKDFVYLFVCLLVVAVVCFVFLAYFVRCCWVLFWRVVSFVLFCCYLVIFGG